MGGLVGDGVAVAVQVVHCGEDLCSFERHLDDVHVGVVRSSEWGRRVKYEDVHDCFPCWNRLHCTTDERSMPALFTFEQQLSENIFI
jgi:hypothetical protein